MKDNIKMMLLTGVVMGAKFGPGSYRERLAWAVEGNPPNIVNLLSDLVERRHRNAPNIQFLPNPPGGFSFYNETDLRVRVPKSSEFDVSCWRVQITSHKTKS
jgi:hypothetical protein